MKPKKRMKIVKRNSTIFFLIVLVTLLSSCEEFEEYTYYPKENIPVSDGIDSAKASALLYDLTELLNSNELLGIQVCVAHNQQSIWSASLGTLDPGQSVPVKNHHLLRIGSVTKIYTATLIMRLVEEGYLSLETNIADFYTQNTNIKEVTVQHLMEHTSGIRDIFTMPAILINATNFPDKQWNPRQLAKTCMEKSLHFEPGSDYSYSNTNYILLGLIAEKVTGIKINELYSKYITEPLGLADTRFVPYDPPPSNLISGYVHHYALSFLEWYPTEPENISWSTLAFSAGAMVTTATELATFMQYLFSGEIVSPESLEAMKGLSNGKGKGLVSTNINGTPYYGHEGEITGFESMVLYQPETGWTIAVCSNTTPFQVKEAVRIINSQL